MERHWYPCNL